MRLASLTGIGIYTPRLPETGRSNELMKWKLLAFPHLGNHNVGLAAAAARDWP